MKACRQSQGEKLLEKGGVQQSVRTAIEMTSHYYTVDDIIKAAHMLQYHAL